VVAWAKAEEARDRKSMVAASRRAACLMGCILNMMTLPPFEGLDYF
jgi:hypothetical protein